MRILVDANIFIDANRRRAGWEKSLGVINLVERRTVEGFVAALTTAFVYFDRLRQHVGERQSRNAVRRMLRHFTVVPLNNELIAKALAHPCPEFEDNVQLVSALEVKADVLITRNKKHFRQRQVRVLTPEEFLAEWPRSDSN